MARKTNLLGGALLFALVLGTAVAAPVGDSEEEILQSLQALSHAPDTTSQLQAHGQEGERMEDEGREMNISIKTAIHEFHLITVLHS